MKLIDREYAIATACSGLIRRIEGCDFRKVEDVRSDLKEVPTVDAEPVRHGKWIHGREVCREYIGTTLVLVQYKHWKCSACGYRTENEPIWKYCPNCGAKMESEQEKQNERF